MSALAWAVVGGAVLFVYLLVFVLCRAAARGDKAMGRERNDD